MIRISPYEISHPVFWEMFLLLYKYQRAFHGPSFFGTAVACAGASTCQLGICRSRGALEAILDRLKSSSADLDAISDLRLHISGCSNTCGQHMIADIGIFGKASRKEHHSYPSYTIVAGAGLDASGKYQLAEKIDEINAHDVPVFIEEIARSYVERKSDYPDFRAYLKSEGTEAIHAICDRSVKCRPLMLTEATIGTGATRTFSRLAGKGTGECSAGLFDLIEIDLARLKAIRAGCWEKAATAPPR